MLSKARIKYIKSLQLKKNRIAENLFLVEGSKSVIEFIGSTFTTVIIYGTDLFWEEHKKLIFSKSINFEIALKKELEQVGTLKSNNAAIALVQIPKLKKLILKKKQWIIALDSINDPGNLGTIIRIADWYGIEQLLLTQNSADIYNPKVINATKGSLTRVQISYVDLPALLRSYKSLIVGADMLGENIYTSTFKKKGILVMGSESHGISSEIQSLLTKKITIPRKGKAESLNVAVATAIICDNLTRFRH